MSKMMTAETAQGHDSAPDSICFAELDGGVVIIRVTGRGSFANSAELKQLIDRVAESHGAGNYSIFVDMEHTTTLDSTFMGALAGAGLRHKRDNGSAMTLVNVNEQCSRLLETVGIKHFVDVRVAPVTGTEDVPEEAFQDCDAANLSRADRIIHMIEAHEKLCELDPENSTRFQSVLKYLNESLERENNKQAS
ncbi:MAG: STAS domain-containing protein [Candidatus Sumerlaeaceae bacterium]|nr:STAS domain-containing protein [Candidatus Sumerlaeaceae bacterium]